jgi:hypothetical protein
MNRIFAMKITTTQAQELKEQLSELPDIRKARGKRHPTISIFAIAICAMLSGCSHFITMASLSDDCKVRLMVASLGAT